MKFRSFAVIAVLLSALVLAACVAFERPQRIGNTNVPEPRQAVDINEYMGTWYEIARYENSFEEGCEGVTAEYSLRWDGRVDVINTCREGSVNGAERSSEGVAKFAEDDTGNNKLKVSFFGPFYGDYWVLDHGNDYQWAIVGEPSGEYLWILARVPQLSQNNMEFLYDRAEKLGYNISMLRKTAQPPL